MREVEPEVRREGEPKVLQKQELKVVQIQEKEQGKKDSVDNSNGCCEPVCSPITCE